MVPKGLLERPGHVPTVYKETFDPKAFNESMNGELERQRQALSLLFASEFSSSKEEYQDSLPRDPLKLKEHMGIPLTPVVIDPSILLQIVAAKTGFDMKCEPSDIKNWEQGKVWTPREPYTAWIAVDKGRNLLQAIDEYRDNPFFRGATVLEALFAALVFPNLLDLEKRVFALGSRVELIHIPSIRRKPKGKQEIGNPVLPLDNPRSLSSVLVAARSF